MSNAIFYELCIFDARKATYMTMIPPAMKKKIVGSIPF